LSNAQCPDGRQVDPVSDSRSVGYHCTLGNHDNAVTDDIVFPILVLLAFVGADSDPWPMRAFWSIIARSM